MDIEDINIIYGVILVIEKVEIHKDSRNYRYFIEFTYNKYYNDSISHSPIMKLRKCKKYFNLIEDIIK